MLFNIKAPTIINVEAVAEDGKRRISGAMKIERKNKN
jgi:hypothetical protein